MTSKRLLPAILLAVIVASALMLTGCGSKEKGISNWVANGGDPSFSSQKELDDSKLMQFGVYPQTKANSSIQNDIKTNVTIDPETGLWNECDNDTMFARYDIETGYYIYAPKKDGVRQEEQYYMACGEDLYLVEPIKWIVLETDGQDSIIISSRILDSGRKYSDLYGECTWASSSMRSWLNGTDSYDISTGDMYNTYLNFINRAFTNDEISKIKSVSISTDDNAVYGTDGGEDTTDKIYLLSQKEFEKYFKAEGSELNASAKATDYAKGKGLSTGSGMLASWWLRDPGSKTYMLGVSRAGDVTEGGYSVNDSDVGIRPVLRVPSSMLKSIPSAENTAG